MASWALGPAGLLCCLALEAVGLLGLLVSCGCWPVSLLGSYAVWSVGLLCCGALGAIGLLGCCSVGLLVYLAVGPLGYYYLFLKIQKNIYVKAQKSTTNTIYIQKIPQKYQKSTGKYKKKYRKHTDKVYKIQEST